MGESKMARVSEIFVSIQGEAQFTGYPTIWVRFFGCNLKCEGFGQNFPKKKETHLLPYQTINFKEYKRMEELPVFETGCDSYYSWYPKTKHLTMNMTEKEIADKIIELAKEMGMEWKYTDDSHKGKFAMLETSKGQPILLGFTGGEPMLQQDKILEIMKHLQNADVEVDNVCIETNGTIEPMRELTSYDNIYFSVSPKLYCVSGEQHALKPDVIRKLVGFGYGLGYLKFVVNDDPECWNEIDNLLNTPQLTENVYQSVCPIYIMPVGSTIEQQKQAGAIAKEALKRGFLLSTRSHVYLWGNSIGT